MLYSEKDKKMGYEVKKFKKGGDTGKLQYEILADVCNLTGFYFFSKVS